MGQKAGQREGARAEGFPFSLPVVRQLEALDFTAPVTFLVGENGAGKSTLLEGIAAGMRATAAGRHDLTRDPSLAGARNFANASRIKLWPPKPGFTDMIKIKSSLSITWSR